MHAATHPRFVGAGRLYHDAESGAYRGEQEVSGKYYSVRATVVTRKDGKREFVTEFFEMPDGARDSILPDISEG